MTAVCSLAPLLTNFIKSCFITLRCDHNPKGADPCYSTHVTLFFHRWLERGFSVASPSELWFWLQWQNLICYSRSLGGRENITLRCFRVIANNRLNNKILSMPCSKKVQDKTWAKKKKSGRNRIFFCKVSIWRGRWMTFLPLSALHPF